MAHRTDRRATASWVLYDLANTLFSFVVLSFYFGPWLVHDLGAIDSAVVVPTSISMAFVLILAPVLGSLADRARRVRFLVASTIVAVVFTALLGAGRLMGLGDNATIWAAIAAYVVANIGYQLGLVFYDALLPVVSTPENMGRVGSIGVGIGYLGSFLGLVAGSLILRWNPAAEPVLFITTGVLFLVLSIPCFLFVKEPKPPVMPPVRPLAEAKQSLRSVVARLRALPRTPNLGRFLVARVLYADAVNTVLLILGIYAVTEAGFEQETFAYTILLAMGILFAILSAPLWGILVDRAGPRNTLRGVLLVWMLALGLVALHPVLDLPRDLFFVYGALVGIGLAGVWSADRPLLVGLVPPAEVGAWFGLYAMAGRFAAITGPLLWGLTVDVLHLGRPVAVLVLGGMVFASFLVLRRLPDPLRADDPLRRLEPWTDGSGRPRRARWRRMLAAPAVSLYLLVTWIVFVLFAERQPGVYVLPGHIAETFAYSIPRLLSDPVHVALTFVTAPLVNHDSIQLVYVTVLLLLFGVPLEAREGSRRFLLVFVVGGALAAILAGLLLHVLYPDVSTHPVLESAWSRTWSGGSAGAFAVMGAFAARARLPWPLLAFFVFWEINVGWWYLRSYTPAFHLTALLLGFVAARWWLRPNAPVPSSSPQPL